jgi:hypothetical protein
MGNSISNSNPVGQALLASVSRASGTPKSRSIRGRPPGCITLHNLCRRCTKMSQSWTESYGIPGRKAKTWVLSHIDMQPRRSFWSSNDCHLCTLIINFINKGNSTDLKSNQPRSNTKIMLHYNNYYINVTVSDTSTPMGEIYLSEFNCMTFV